MRYQVDMKRVWIMKRIPKDTSSSLALVLETEKLLNE